MTSRTDDLTVHVRYKDVEKTFSGNIEQVWQGLTRFFFEFLPTFEIAQKLMLKVDINEVAKNLEGLITFSKEGPNVLVTRNKLTDSEALTLWLLASYVGNQLGILSSDAISKEELQVKIGKDAKITSTRVGELAKNQIVARTDDEKYRITSFGVVQMQKDILPRIRAKTSV